MQLKERVLLFSCTFIIIMMIVYKNPMNLGLVQIKLRRQQLTKIDIEDSSQSEEFPSYQRQEFSHYHNEETFSNKSKQSFSNQLMELPSTKQWKESPRSQSEESSNDHSDKFPSNQSKTTSSKQHDQSFSNQSEQFSNNKSQEKSNNTGDDCKALHFSKDPLPVTALYSYPGSGNTWIRHIIQQATGIYTGSIYNDMGLKAAGFFGEHHKDGSVIVVKLHKPYQAKYAYFEKAIVLIRNPAEAFRAQFIFRHSPGHTGHLPEEAFQTKQWIRFAPGISSEWENNYLSWSKFPGPLLFVHYEHLVQNLEGELRRILDFLGQDISNEDIQCVLNNVEGQQHRPAVKFNFDLYTPEMIKYMENIYSKIINVYKERQDP